MKNKNIPPLTEEQKSTIVREWFLDNNFKPNHILRQIAIIRLFLEKLSIHGLTYPFSDNLCKHISPIGSIARRITKKYRAKHRLSN